MQNNDIEIDEQYDDTLSNLRDFLGYLEDKNIINGQQLEDKHEINNLIKDLMKLDLAKFSNIRKTSNSKKKKGGSRNVNVSVNRSNSLNPHSINPSQCNDNAGRKTQSVSSKNIYRVYAGGHASEQSEDFKSSRKLSYCPEEESKAAVYQALRSSNQTPKGFENSNNQGIPSNLNYMTPINDSSNYHSKRYEISNRGKTAPSSTHNSKERTAVPEILKNHLLAKQKLNSHSNADILKNSQVNQGSLQGDTKDTQNNALVNLGNSQPKRSGSQKIRGNSQHFMKRKDGVMSIDNQNQDITKILKEKLNQERSRDSVENKDKDEANLDASENPKNYSIDSSSNCQMVEQGVDKVTFNIKLKDEILDERERMIKAIKIYIRKHKRLPPTTLDYYKFVKLVGKGAFGKVTLGIHKLTGKQVAIKTIEKAYMKDDFSRKKVLQEVYILKNIKHSNVIRLLEVFESPKHLLIVMEYSGGGDLLKYIKKYGRLEEVKAREYFIQIVYGLAHCH
jgi:hypothetical protein